MKTCAELPFRTMVECAQAKDPEEMSKSPPTESVSDPAAAMEPATVASPATEKLCPASESEAPEASEIDAHAESAERTGWLAGVPGMTMKSEAIGARARLQFSARPHASDAAPVQTLVSPAETDSKRQLSLPPRSCELMASASAPPEASLPETETWDICCAASLPRTRFQEPPFSAHPSDTGLPSSPSAEKRPDTDSVAPDAKDSDLPAVWQMKFSAVRLPRMVAGAFPAKTSAEPSSATNEPPAALVIAKSPFTVSVFPSLTRRRDPRPMTTDPTSVSVTSTPISVAPMVVAL